MKLRRNRPAVMKGFIVSIVIVGMLAVTGLASVKAEAAPSCRTFVQTQAGRFEGSVSTSYRTSCPFARNVVEASLRRIIATGGAGNGTFTTSAYSPVTRMWYRVSCVANGDINRVIWVDCRAGVGARVVYRARSY